MAGSVITVIQPGGSTGTKYNVRASGLRYFIKSASATPADGSIGGNSTSAYKLTCTDITELWAGMTFVIEMPSTPTVETPTLQINSLGAKNMKPTNGSNGLSLVEDRRYLVTYDGSVFLITNAEQVAHASTSITANSYSIPDGNAIYDYVTSQVTNRWSYVISTNASNTPQGAELYTGTTTVTGTLVASAGTEYKIYLVRHNHDSLGTNTGTNNQDYYDEWITVKNGNTYKWEKIGNTDIDTASIAAVIVDTIIGSIADHTYVKPTGSGSVTLGSHSHTFNGASMTSTGSFTPAGTINVGQDIDGTTYTPAGTISTNASTGSSYAPAGTVISTFAGTNNYVKFSGSSATISMSASNVTTGNQDASGVSLTLVKVEPTEYGPWSSIVPNASVSGSSSVSTDTSTIGTHTHSIPNLSGSVSVNGSSFTVSTKAATSIAIGATTGTTVEHATFTVPIASASVTTQPAYTSVSTGTHTHIGTLNQFSASGSLSSAGTASSYTVSNEVLTLTPSTVPGTSVSMTIATQSLSIANAGAHSHTISRSTDAAISVTGGQVKIIGTTAAHNHTLSGTASPTVSVTGATTGEGGGHKHTISISGSDIASKISVSVGTIWAKGTMGNHTHTITSLSLSTSYTPTGSLAIGTSTDYNIKPSGTVTSSFSGTSTKFAFSGTSTKFAFNGTNGSVSVSGTTTGSVSETNLGNKTVTVATENGTLTHTKKNS